jgi:DNA gyrase subunit A
MARKSATPTHGPAVEGRIVDVDVSSEMRGSFLEYAYSVIYSRALPDARDGLKPVQRRILYRMAQLGLRPDRGHVKSARVVGDVMGTLHPHGDGAIYDALVRMSQDFSLRLPLIDGHGNFGSLSDGPAAQRYTECRLAAAALSLTESLDEDVVDFAPNYDGQDSEPVVLPAGIPNLLVNGASGIAVGMATSIPPHNLIEVIAAARHLINHPEARLDTLMKHVPGPDLPSGGQIVGIEGLRDIYETGRGAFRMRATATIEQISPRKQGIIVTALPYNVGPERLIDKIKDAVTSKKLQGISDVTDLSDHDHGMRLVIEIKSGFNADAVLSALHRLTPLEEAFNVNMVTLVDGQPRTLGLRELLLVFLDHRYEVVRRRCTHRRGKAQERLHLVEGLLTAILDIDEVIAVIRSSDDTAAARERLTQVFDLSETQVNYILEMPLRRLTKFSRIELEAEATELTSTIAALSEILDDDKLLRTVVSDELAEMSRIHGTERRTTLVADSGVTVTAVTPLEVADEPCWVILSASGLISRTTSDSLPDFGSSRSAHDAIADTLATSARSQIGVVTSNGRVVRASVIELPTLTSPSLAGAPAAAEMLHLERDEQAVALVNLADGGPDLLLVTRQGIVKRVAPDVPQTQAAWGVIRLDDGDHVVAAADGAGQKCQIVIITTDAQLLRFDASVVRAQGRPAGGVTAIRLSQDATVLAAAIVRTPLADAEVVTIAGSFSALPGTEPGSAKRTALSAFPAKGRATAGVRCHHLRKGEDGLLLAWIGPGPARALSAKGTPVDLPAEQTKRDGSGTPLSSAVAHMGHAGISSDSATSI